MNGGNKTMNAERTMEIESAVEIAKIANEKIPNEQVLIRMTLLKTILFLVKVAGAFWLAELFGVIEAIATR